jgi:uncharacterized membrane protein YdjX (TVP38/TMEM64 family)
MNEMLFSSAKIMFRSPWLGMVASISFVTLILAVLVYFNVHEQVVALLEWFQVHGAWASVLFILVMALAVVLLMPGAFLTMGAGFVFGVVEGTVYVVVGTTLGATISFLISRYLFGERASRYVVSHMRLRMLSEAMTPNDWKIVLLTRLIPFFPNKLANYFFGLTEFRFLRYTGASFVGFVPISLHNVYLGSILADLSQLGSRETERSLLEWMVYGTGFVTTVIAVVYFNRLSRRALASYAQI